MAATNTDAHRSHVVDAEQSMNQSAEPHQLEDMQEHSMEPCSSYHELFLHPSGETFLQPILFEHAMDAVECEHYYSVLSSYTIGGAVRRPPNKPSPPFCESVAVVSGQPRSILRSGRAKQAPVAMKEAPVRRCSFSGLLPDRDIDETFDLRLARSQSIRSVNESNSVSFQHFVQVFAIPAIADIPIEIRDNLWMSRDEMLVSIHEAALATMEEQQGQQDQCEAPPEIDRDHLLQRQQSSDSVIEEYLQTYVACNFQECAA